MYKNYTVREVILNDYQTPETAVVIDVPCGCNQCQDLDEVQPGHFACGLLPESLRNDENIFPRLNRNEWLAEFVGDYSHVDEWLEQ